jgi:hypothetical protein
VLRAHGEGQAGGGTVALALVGEGQAEGGEARQEGDLSVGPGEGREERQRGEDRGEWHPRVPIRGRGPYSYRRPHTGQRSGRRLGPAARRMQAVAATRIIVSSRVNHRGAKSVSP